MKRMLDQVAINRLKAILNEIDTGTFIAPKVHLQDIEDLTLSDFGALFPSLENNGGKVVKVKEDEKGFEYGEVSGGTQLYRHNVLLQGKNIEDNTVDIIFYIITTDNANIEDTEEIPEILLGFGIAVEVQGGTSGYDNDRNDFTGFIDEVFDALFSKYKGTLSGDYSYESVSDTIIAL